MNEILKTPALDYESASFIMNMFQGHFKL